MKRAFVGHGLFFQLYLGLLASLSVVVTLSMIPALPDMRLYFGCQSTLATWTITAAMTGVLLSQFVWGGISDHYGRQKTFFCLCALASLASLCCFCAPNIYVVLGGRFFQGFAAGGAPVLVRALCRDVYQGAHLRRVIAWILTVIPFSAGCVPAFADILVQRFGWGMPSLFVFFYAGILGLLCPLFLPSNEKKPAQARVVSNIWSGYRTAFVDSYTLKLTLMSSFIYASFYVYIPVSPWLFEAHYNLDGMMKSLALISFPFGTFLGGALQSWVGWRFSGFSVGFFCALVGVVSLLTTLLFFLGNSGVFGHLLSMMFFGACMAILNAVCMASVMSRHSAALSGSVSSFLGVCQTLGCVVGSFIAGYVSSGFLASFIILGFISSGLVLAFSAWTAESQQFLRFVRDCVISVRRS